MGSSFSIAWVNAGHELEVPERRSESDRHILLSKKRWRGQLPASQHQPPSGSAGYFRGLCIDANDLAFLHEQRDLHFKTCLEFCNFLCAAGSCVAAPGSGIPGPAQPGGAERLSAGEVRLEFDPHLTRF